MQETMTIQEKVCLKKQKTILDTTDFLMRGIRLPSSGHLPLEVFSVAFLLCIFFH